jgi:hypothetical protein
MQMMQELFQSNTESAVYTLIFIVTIMGLILIYFSYMILSELKEMKTVFNRVEKLLESVE